MNLSLKLDVLFFDIVLKGYSESWFLLLIMKFSCVNLLNNFFCTVDFSFLNFLIKMSIYLQTKSALPEEDKVLKPNIVQIRNLRKLVSMQNEEIDIKQQCENFDLTTVL